MRVAGIVLAVVLIAACPPRRGRVVYVQPCPAPCVIVSAPPAAPPSVAEKPLDPAVEAHLVAWEKKIAGLTNVRAEVSLRRTDVVLKKETNYNGVVLCLKPNYLIMRLDNPTDPTKTDYEAYIHDGKSWYIYEAKKKTITEVKVPVDPSLRWLWSGDTPVLDLLTTPRAKAISERFEVRLFKTDDHYVYLEFQPRLDKDAREFKQLRLALYGPGEATAKVAYLPAQLYILKPNGDSEAWKISSPQVDIPGVRPQDFKKAEIPGWKVERAPEPGKP